MGNVPIKGLEKEKMQGMPLKERKIDKIGRNTRRENTAA